VPFGLEIIGLVAAGTFAATLGMGARLYGRLQPVSPSPKKSAKTALHVAVAAERARAKRHMAPEKIALQVVEYLRAEGLHAYPLIPEDLDDAINLWCDDAGIERGSTQTIRELIALLPGVKRDRARLNPTNPKHRSVQNRLIAHKRAVKDKATFYVISDPPTDQLGTPEAEAWAGPGTPVGQTFEAVGTVQRVPKVCRSHGRSGREAGRARDQGSAQDMRRVA